MLLHRPFQPPDEPALAALYLHPDVVWQMAFDPIPASAFGEILAELRAGAELMVVEEAGVLVAAYRIVPGTRRLSHVAHIGSVAVRADLQGRGLGRRIMTDVLASLRARGFRRIELSTGADNARALALYLSLGFEREGTMRAFFSRHGQPGLHDEVLLSIVAPGA